MIGRQEYLNCLFNKVKCIKNMDLLHVGVGVTSSSKKETCESVPPGGAAGPATPSKLDNSTSLYVMCLESYIFVYFVF